MSKCILYASTTKIRSRPFLSKNVDASQDDTLNDMQSLKSLDLCIVMMSRPYIAIIPFHQSWSRRSSSSSADTHSDDVTKATLVMTSLPPGGGCLARTCRSRSRRRTSTLPQWRHLYGAEPPPTSAADCACNRMCLLRLLGSPKGRRQTEHCSGLNPVWVRTWIFSP